MTEAEENLERTDKVAKALAEAYHRQGEFAITIRTIDNNGNFRIISPSISAPILAEFLHQVADRVFDGEALSSRVMN